MARKARLGLYLESEELKRQVKIAAARRGLSVTAYCAEAIEEHVKGEGGMGDAAANRRALLYRMDKLREEIGPVKKTTAELVKEGRRR